MSSAILLSQSDVASLLSMPNCIRAVEEAFRLHGEGKAGKPGILGIHTEGGGFHIKAGILDLENGMPLFAAKLNGNFPQNRARFSMPTIQGVLVLCNATNGLPLAIMDSIEITIQRTGAATAVAAKYLARKDSAVVTICGCGNQGKSQLRALANVLPLRKVIAIDSDPQRAQTYCDEVSREHSLEAVPANILQLKDALQKSDVCVTCTPSKKWFLAREHAPNGMFIAAVGADNEDKQELQPELMAAAKVVTDITDQCATIGDLHHAIAAGVITRDHVYAELGELVAGKKEGRTSANEITVFDSTGMALQDVAAAISVYQAAIRSGKGNSFSFA